MKTQMENCTVEPIAPVIASRDAAGLAGTRRHDG